MNSLSFPLNGSHSSQSSSRTSSRPENVNITSQSIAKTSKSSRHSSRSDTHPNRVVLSTHSHSIFLYSRRQHAALYDPASQSLSLESRHPASSALSRRQPSSLIRPAGIHSSSQDETNPAPTSQPQPFCSTCLRPFPWSSVSSNDDDQEDSATSTHPHYFRLLAEATSLPGSQVPSRTATPTPGSGSRSRRQETSNDNANESEGLDDDVGVEGYYERFFVEEKKLGRGARGTVYLCQVSRFLTQSFFSYSRSLTVILIVFSPARIEWKQPRKVCDQKDPSRFKFKESSQVFE